MKKIIFVNGMWGMGKSHYISSLNSKEYRIFDENYIKGQGRMRYFSHRNLIIEFIDDWYESQGLRYPERTTKKLIKIPVSMKATPNTVVIERTPVFMEGLSRAMLLKPFMGVEDNVEMNKLTKYWSNDFREQVDYILRLYADHNEELTVEFVYYAPSNYFKYHTDLKKYAESGVASKMNFGKEVTWVESKMLNAFPTMGQLVCIEETFKEFAESFDNPRVTFRIDHGYNGNFNAKERWE